MVTWNRIWLAACLIAVTTAHAADGVFKWVDKDGRVHYSDTPPPGAKASKLANTRAAPAPAPEAAAGEAKGPKTYVEQEIEFRQRRMAEEEKQQEAQKQKQQADSVREACTQSRSQLAMLREGGRVSTRNEKGEKIYYDDKMRAAAIAKEQKFLEQHCKS